MDKSETESFEYQSVTTLKGVGPAVAEKLEKLEIYTLQDILFHLPLRYEDRTRVVPLGSLRAGQQVLVEGVIEHSEMKYTGKGRRSLLCHLSDNTGAITLRFFHFNKTQQQHLSRGNRLRCFGETRFGLNRLEMVHPEYKVVRADMEVEQSLTPVYPKTDGVHQSLLKKLSDQVLQKMQQDSLPDWLPPAVMEEYDFPVLASALSSVHRPAGNTRPEQLETANSRAQQRLIFEELLAHQLSLQLSRQKIRRQRAVALLVAKNFIPGFEKMLGFKLTQAQERVIAEIFADLGREQPMLRLVQGDVGSGKTAVAAAAALAATANGRQVAIMAPTEILAEQHLLNFSRWFGCENCLLLTGRDKGKQRQQKLAMIAQGEVPVIIGTHALFQDEVVFSDLALLVVDEQHRFGVHQRLALREKGRNGNTVPHQLIMTATPIPRSLAMTAYADLDYSVIDELPAGRKPVTTVVVSGSRREEVITRIKNACEKGEQAYWVCTLVEESEFLQCQAAEDTAEKLDRELKNLRVALVHGRMKQEEKQAVVERFKNREIDLLVATTVIEVGVDVPNASLMVIENAERLGLAQLHQLRGRVGRGGRQSACVLMYQPPLSENGKQRLAILRETGDGFRIAQKDLELRGPGEVLGTKQTGLMQMRIADIVRDEHWFEAVKQAAQFILEQHPETVRPLVRRWLGKADRFVNV
ncbi:MAG TPA: ATP-dependent DNA helicase RecG [Gammaproteobacteria bacterium]|nr:ATP-dependent DNA helicase RecG [Gammaproteobacteria bacterium]